MSTILVVDQLHTFYEKSHVLHGVSLKVDKGEIVAILGRNGAGKTTTLKSIMGVVRPRSGIILFNGKDLTGISPHQIPKLGLGYVPQGRGIFPDLTVRENLLIGALAKGRKQDAIEEALSLFPSLKERLEQAGGTLSGGEQQMLAIGRAMAAQPELLLMDEPTEGLMPSMVRTVLDITKRINSEGASVLIVEQKLDLALKLSNRILIMENGSIKFEGTPKDLIDNKETVLKHIGIKA